MFNTKYSDEQILQQIFQAVVQCFQQDVQFPVKLTAIDAIRTLVNEDLVADHVAEQAPQLMETLLDMSKKIESDMLSSVMDSFVQKFAKNLEPYANQLSSRLAEQFLGLATELLNASSNDASSIDTTKEYQAAGILNTLVELVIATNSSPDVSTSIQSTLKPIELLAGETNPKVFDPEVDDDEYDAALYDDDFEADEAEMEALKRTPIDEINVFAVFCSKVSLMQQSDANRYQVCFGGLDDDQKELAQRIAEIDQQK
ncbi:hypothetical protein QCA50_012850 [Cerrena zonata]|uniref:Uncharacterized protein n=1 Tax=Cerrena zonata TaxID=2478898 RepID=A0AAW0FWS6_9APHY